ncbi:hypothetical protein ABBQ32_002191 [Trebouxia sp. C0010 RCD-2024]
MAQFVRSVISWGVTDLIGRSQCVTPLYGSRRRYPILAVRGFMGAVAMALYYEAFERLMLGEAMTLYFVYPAITVIMAWLVYGEVATWVSVAGCAVSLLGVAFIAQPPFIFGGSVQYDMSHWLGVACAFGAAFSAAAAFIAVRGIKKDEASVTLALWFHFIAVFASILPLAFGYPRSPVLPALKDWVPLLAISATSCINQICLNRGFQLEVAAKASAMNYTMVLWAHVWGVAFLGERESWPGLFGSALLAAGVVSVSSSKAKAPELGPDETTAFVTSMQSKAPDFEDVRITMADGVQSDEWRHTPATPQPHPKATHDDLEIQMRSESKS